MNTSDKYIQIIINGVTYNVLKRSRIEDLLIDIKKLIEEGGGGGGDAKPMTPEQMAALTDAINNGGN